MRRFAGCHLRSSGGNAAIWDGGKSNRHDPLHDSSKEERPKLSTCASRRSAGPIMRPAPRPAHKWPLSLTSEGGEYHRIGGTAGSLRNLHGRSHVHLIGILSGDRWIITWRRIEDTVVVEVPAKPHVALRRSERGGQRDVDIITALALLTLYARREGHRRRG